MMQTSGSANELTEDEAVLGPQRLPAGGVAPPGEERRGELAGMWKA
jgi:hypothetical protein